MFQSLIFNLDIPKQDSTISEKPLISALPKMKKESTFKVSKGNLKEELFKRYNSSIKLNLFDMSIEEEPCLVKTKSQYPKPFKYLGSIISKFNNMNSCKSRQPFLKKIFVTSKDN